jgi:hypothetical protein
MVPSLPNSAPDFLIIGAQKCGTTSLFHYLSQHPDIDLPKTKEIHFFDNNYSLGNDWYFQHFSKKIKLEYKITGEASPYYLFHPLVPERVESTIPNTKLIIMLRNPIYRAHSHFMHEKRLKFEHINSFEEAIKFEKSRVGTAENKLRLREVEHSFAHQHYSYINRGMYFKQISYWLQYFAIDNMCFIKSEDFFTNPKLELLNIYSFLGVSEVLPADLTPQNTNDYNRITEITTTKLLTETFRNDSAKLIQLIGDKFRW